MTTPPFCFVIIPINRSETEFLWNEVYYPVVKEAGYIPERIDKEDDGSIIPKLIMEKIINSDLVVADLTLERPNCYFELGFAYGIPEKKDAQIIVCCREDHFHDSENYTREHKVHFDFSWRTIVWWEKSNLAGFKEALAEKIASRKRILLEQSRRPEGKTNEPTKESTQHEKDLRLRERLEQARQEVSKDE